MSESENTLDVIERLSAGNPDVDVEQVVEASRLVEALRDKGMPKPEYNIEPPYNPFSRRARPES